MSEALKKNLHRTYIGSMSLIVIVTTIYLSYVGYAYYSTPLEERFYTPHHDWFKPSGIYGQGLGVFGTLMMFVGVVVYILRKRYNIMSRFIRLKYLLEFHIFLCILGPILILFHTAFKFGGIVSIAFWSMVAVVASGFIGRFIYVQIPHTVEGRELTLEEVKQMKADLEKTLKNKFQLEEDIAQLIAHSTKDNTLGKESSSYIANYFADRKTLNEVRKALKKKQFNKTEQKAILEIVKDELSLSNKIRRLQTMKKLFKYWHVAHLPFALIMLIIVVVHVIVAIAFGYTWIF